MANEIVFEHPFGVGALVCRATMDVVETGAGAYAPSTVIQRDQTWEVRFHWEIDGPAADMLGGTWVVTLALESIGPGAEWDHHDAVEVDSAGLALPRVYNNTFPMPVNSPLLPEGTYRLMGIITHHNHDPLNNAVHPSEIAGYLEGPIVQLYNA
jgi:hypothetical protein